MNCRSCRCGSVFVFARLHGFKTRLGVEELRRILLIQRGSRQKTLCRFGNSKLTAAAESKHDVIPPRLFLFAFCTPCPRTHVGPCSCVQQQGGVFCGGVGARRAFRGRVRANGAGANRGGFYWPGKFLSCRVTGHILALSSSGSGPVLER